MVKIIFVCYNHGTGGETLSQKISLLEQCNNLTYKKFCDLNKLKTSVKIDNADVDFID